MIYGGIYIANLLGGPTDMFEQLREVKPENLVLQDNAWMAWLAMFIITPVGSFMGPQLWTRMYAVKSPKLFNLMPFLLGFAAIAYIGSMLVGNSAVLLEPAIEQSDKVLPVILYKYALYNGILYHRLRCGCCNVTAYPRFIHVTVYTVDFPKTFSIRSSEKHWFGSEMVHLILSAVA